MSYDLITITYEVPTKTYELPTKTYEPSRSVTNDPEVTVFSSVYIKCPVGDGASLVSGQPLTAN